MKCPCCGYEMGTANKCLRCGYVDRSVATVDENQNKENEEVIKVIDPSQVVLVETPIEEDDEPSYYDPISSLFDSFFGNPINDILNMFGFGTGRTSRRTQYGGGEKSRPRKDKKIYEFEEVEILDKNDKPIYQSKKNKNKNDNKLI